MIFQLYRQLRSVFCDGTIALIVIIVGLSVLSRVGYNLDLRYNKLRAYFFHPYLAIRYGGGPAKLSKELDREINKHPLQEVWIR